MTRKIGVLVVHGMGSQRAGYSSELSDAVSKRMGQLRNRLEWKEVLWAGALESRENALWDCMHRAAEPEGASIDLDWRRVREFVVHNFGDAVAYQRDSVTEGSAYTAVHRIISSRLRSLKLALADASAPIVVVAHSLGAHMMSNYIWDRQRPRAADTSGLEDIPTLVSIITFGCNIPLFSLAFPFARPIRLPGKGIRKAGLKTESRWLNFLDRDDVLGWPLKPLYAKDLSRLNRAQKETVTRIEDREINVGSLSTSWNPAAHGDYWTDRDLIRPIADHLERLAHVLDP